MGHEQPVIITLYPESLYTQTIINKRTLHTIIDGLVLFWLYGFMFSSLIIGKEAVSLIFCYFIFLRWSVPLYNQQFLVPLKSNKPDGYSLFEAYSSSM